MRDNFHKYGVLIPATGLITVYEVEINKELRSLQEAVGGHIEPIPCSNGDLLLCNEHAKFKNLPINTGLLNMRSLTWLPYPETGKVL